MEAQSRKNRGLAALALTLWLLPVLSLAGTPTEQIRGTIDRTIGILKDPALAAKGKEEERRELLRKEIAPVFDFGEMAKRSLGPNWRDRTPEERERFVALFRELLENSYLGKIESYGGEVIRYGEETVDGPYAQVKTVVVTTRGQEIPVHYRMRADGGRYRIYDVVIEGISLVNNYRSQFNSILQKSSFAELMEKLRSTVREQQKS
ncbi:MAG: ABC transporter substrate-binding protein [Deltaproteobacteria bacterium]|jgi:phospholipid transport system substrate-binding protein|nr:MAG: ABC transporter substrate-binding protein [Deltaproteobacteria bacterium]